MAPKDKLPDLEDFPEQFRRVIVRLMANENLDLAQALDRASILIDKNSAKFEMELQSRANTLYKSRHMVELNKARAGWKAEHEKALLDTRVKGFDDGQKWVRENEHVWHVPCSACSQPMTFSSKDANFADQYEVLKEAFKNWKHTDCNSSS
jgi:hypothetical protein